MKKTEAIWVPSSASHKVSIVIPSYGQAEYLPSAIESALSQTTRCEVIVVDDGSTDNSAEIAKNYPVKLIRQTNKGLPSARNTGIMNATCDYILPLDADDILEDTCVERLLQVAEATSADIVAPSFKSFGVENGLTILLPAPSIEDFKRGNHIGYCALIKREALLEVGGYNPKMVFGWEDYDLWFDLLKRDKKLVTVQEPLWLYRTKEASMIHEANKHGQELKEQIMKNHPTIYA